MCEILQLFKNNLSDTEYPRLNVQLKKERIIFIFLHFRDKIFKILKIERYKLIHVLISKLLNHVL